MVKIVRIFVASPGDVAAERAHVREAVRSLNRFMAAERGVLFVVKGWEEDVLERLHEMGGQGVIDEDLPIETFDIVIGVLWQRFGTKDPKLGGETGTEHELRGAIAAWGKSKRPNVAMCFNDAPFKAKGAEAYEKAAQVERFRDEYGKLGLYITYEGADQFRDKIREWLEKYLIAKHPMAEGKKSTTIPGDPSRYISALQDQTSKIEVQGLRFGDNKAYQFPIEDFYIPLTTSAASREQTAPEGRHVQLQEALLAHRKLMVVGDPGSGKTTFLRRVVHQLCKERRDDALPIWIGAAALAEFKPANPPPEPWSPEWIPLYAGSHCEQYNRGLTADYFKAKLRAGECHVLIDGLDETPDEASRERIARLIRESADSFDKCRFAVTSRPEGKVAIRGFEEALIDDLEPEAIRAFLAKLAGFLYSSDEVKERQFRDDLKQAVKSGEIRKMARNPVMLTALAVLQHNNIKLPERRVDLYGSILEWLSKQRAKPDRLPANECLLRFRTLALAMQDHPEGRKKQAPLEWASRTLGKDLGGREKAARFLKKRNPIAASWSRRGVRSRSGI
ncbi:MAG: NACHT domain-containing protein [Bryobacteraceae bacterium]